MIHSLYCKQMATINIIFSRILLICPLRIYNNKSILEKNYQKLKKILQFFQFLIKFIKNRFVINRTFFLVKPIKTCLTSAKQTVKSKKCCVSVVLFHNHTVFLSFHFHFLCSVNWLARVLIKKNS